MRSRLLDDALRGKVMGCEERCEVIPPLVICRETSENRAGGGLSKRRRRVERKVTRVSLLSRFQHVTKTYSSVNTWSAKMYDGFGFSSLGFWVRFSKSAIENRPAHVSNHNLRKE
ncbi:unnamed protein product [Brassica rapa]|uniref:Uncharacterized protein n=1 Tax=Brassica campestris TaxID=3711 RepID=A0A8D9D6R7_BRACM|nr:unnamed protein product [Brassica rapa]